jgi:hypothetical protein
MKSQPVLEATCHEHIIRIKINNGRNIHNTWTFSNTIMKASNLAEIFMLKLHFNCTIFLKNGLIHIKIKICLWEGVVNAMPGKESTTNCQTFEVS